jgi:hypothetical protein
LYSALNLLGQLLEIVRGELGVELDAAVFLHHVDELLKIFFADSSMTTSENIWMKRR